MLWVAILASVGGVAAAVAVLGIILRWHEWAVVPTAFASIAALAVCAAILIDQAACDRFGGNLQAPVQYEVVGGCYVKIADRFVPADQARFVSENDHLIVHIEDEG